MLGLAGLAGAGAIPPSRREPAVGEDYHIEACIRLVGRRPVVDRELRVARHPRHRRRSDRRPRHRAEPARQVQRRAQPAQEASLQVPAPADQVRDRRVPGAARSSSSTASATASACRSTTEVDFSTDSFGYEYDFLYRSRGFVGAQRQHEVHRRRRRPQSPIAIGVLPSRRRRFRRSASPAAATSRRTWRSIRRCVLPHSRQPRAATTATAATTTSTSHATYNFNKYVGAQLGWRKTTIFYEGRPRHAAI